MSNKTPLEPCESPKTPISTMEPGKGSDPDPELVYDNEPLSDELELARAGTIVGGKSVNGTASSRVFDFSLPFNSPAPSKFTTYLNKLIPLGSFSLLSPSSSPFPLSFSEQEAPLTWDSDETASQEYERYSNLKSMCPRSHALRSSILPSSPKLGPDPIPRIKGNVIMMGGYRGSTLRETDTDRLLWMPLSAGFKMRQLNLELPLDDGAEERAHETVYPDGMLSSVGPVDVSKKLMKTLRSQKHCNLLDYGWDWRLSGEHNSKRLYDYIKSLYDTAPNDSSEGVIIIAHSLGGMIAHHALQRFVRESDGTPQTYIRGIVYAGCPSTVEPILGPFQRGDSVLFAKNILTAKATFTMRSSFLLLPEDGRCFVETNNVDNDLKLDYFDPDVWVKYSLSPCVSLDPKMRPLQTAGDPDITELDQKEAYEYLKKTLKRTKDFKNELHRIPGAKYPPLAVVYGNSVPTCRGCRYDSKEDLIHVREYSNFYYGAGDGVVHRKRLLPLNEGFEDSETFTTKEGHVCLLSDLKVVGDALASIIEREGSTLPKPEPWPISTISRIKSLAKEMAVLS